jgi:carboxyl-terminal processing protease
VGFGQGTASGVDSVQTFKTAFTKIQSDYVEKLDAKKLKYAALSGMLSSLGDPHTQFLEPRFAKEFRIETEAKFAGVGARLAPDPLGARVAIVFDEGPAAREGLRREDLITAVDGKPVGGLDITQIVDQIRGKVGTSVTLQVVRKGVEKPLSIRIKREEVVAPTVEAHVLPGVRIGYMSVTLFSQPTADQFERALASLENDKIRGLIIDVRGNPGGLLESAAEVLGRFLDGKIVVKMKGRDGDEEIVRTPRGQAHPAKYPIVTLIDDDSASAAEIFAGVMRDYRLTTLVGEHSYGKASVQEVIPMVDDASVKITIAKYFLPGGQDISRKVDEYGQYVSGGIEPDVKVEFDFALAAAAGQSGADGPNPNADSQLKRAVEIIEKKLGGELAAALSGGAREAAPILRAVSYRFSMVA